MSSFERRFLSSFLRSLSQGAWLASVSLSRERRATGIFRGVGRFRESPWRVLMPSLVHVANACQIASVKTKNKTPEFCETLRQAESRWHISRAELSRAKAAGCSGFRGGRLYKIEIVEWLRDHPAKVGEGQAENLRTEKTRKQIEKLALEIDVTRGKLVARETAKQFFGEVMADLFEIIGRHVSRDVFNALSRDLRNAIGSRGECAAL